MKFEKFKPENYKNVDIKFTLRLPEELHQDIASYSNFNEYPNIKLY